MQTKKFLSMAALLLAAAMLFGLPGCARDAENLANATEIPTPEATFPAATDMPGLPASAIVELPDWDLRFTLCTPMWEMTKHEAGITFTWYPYDSRSPMINFLMVPLRGILIITLESS
ncbi:MAG: hypothetical protein FWF10_01275 [Clostridiales bacterium]|nr:hypothetical protein [Clostridiales bacterium]